MKQFKNTYFDIKKTGVLKFLIEYVVLCTFAISSIIRADFLYVDDYGRTYSGDVNDWNVYSRYLGKLLCKIMSGNKVVNDTSPLPQIVTIILMAISAALIIYALAPEKMRSKLMLIASVILTINPYFLENISLKIESILHGATTVLAALPLLFYKKRNIGYSLFVAVCIFLTCLTYQGATGLFPLFVIIIAADEWNEGKELKEIGKLIISSAAGYVAGLIYFRVLVMKPVQTHVSSEMLGIGKLLPGLFKNWFTYFQTVHQDFNAIWEILIILVIIFFCCIFVLHSKRNKAAAFFVSIITVALSAMSCMGIYVLLAEPIYEPRVMRVFGCFISLLCIYSVGRADKVMLYLSGIVSVVIVWCFITFSLTYGNCLSLQKEYTESRIQMIINWLNENCDRDESYKMDLRGGIGYAPAAVNDVECYPLLDKLIPKTLDGSWGWSQYRLYYFYNIPDNIITSSWLVEDSDKFDPNAMDLTEELLWFDVYRKDEKLLIYLK